MTARLAAEYSKLVLQGQDVELLWSSESARRCSYSSTFLIMHLQANDWGIVRRPRSSSVIATMAVPEVAPVDGDGLLQIGGEGRDSAATRKRIAKERHAAKSCQ